MPRFLRSLQCVAISGILLVNHSIRCYKVQRDGYPPTGRSLLRIPTERVRIPL
nr:MAG TPA: hypothetical protein [Microviridae sp.]